MSGFMRPTHASSMRQGMTTGDTSDSRPTSGASKPAKPQAVYQGDRVSMEGNEEPLFGSSKRNLNPSHRRRHLAETTSQTNLLGQVDLDADGDLWESAMSSLRMATPPPTSGGSRKTSGNFMRDTKSTSRRSVTPSKGSSESRRVSATGKQKGMRQSDLWRAAPGHNPVASLRTSGSYKRSSLSSSGLKDGSHGYSTSINAIGTPKESGKPNRSAIQKYEGMIRQTELNQSREQETKSRNDAKIAKIPYKSTRAGMEDLSEGRLILEKRPSDTTGMARLHRMSWRNEDYIHQSSASGYQKEEGGPGQRIKSSPFIAPRSEQNRDRAQSDAVDEDTAWEEERRKLKMVRLGLLLIILGAIYADKAAQVYQPMTIQWWAGRFSSTRDRRINDHLQGLDQLPDSISLSRSSNDDPYFHIERSSNTNISSEEQEAREIISELYADCQVEEARYSLKRFQHHYAQETYLENLISWVPYVATLPLPSMHVPKPSDFAAVERVEEKDSANNGEPSLGSRKRPDNKESRGSEMRKPSFLERLMSGKSRRSNRSSDDHD
ncbi:hypothetical protein K402DRAFT_57773 [Aulographum hederae CBS 113979]|uniref:Uncharacterized protein n=1 Tax=Aulographum hederae CBS 113979 TaxID=1176131 RepID=A0A6G1H2B7_9PEZI|nr:hypothetical protein K402DRAFT_57773 [Aulographum hederae CBS 113979]